ncbi:von Willebrand factor type A domain-containing protein [Alistipes dispar]|uniref:YfbK domain-containing protein n=1 Tax=Alistipes dispar TaxID=2585119 RepID=UPI002942E481|nr:von Willebrand factor type A domain-containing protein [Alistipes dispar]
MKSLPFLLACLLPLGAAAQSHTVAGRVVSAGDNAPLAGCSVVVKHTSRGTVTGPDGRYEIGAAPGDTLRFSFVGFRTAEEPVGRRTRIDVVLEAAAEAVFEECVVEVSGMQDAAGPVAGLSRRRAGSAALPFVQPGREEYAHYEENRFRSALQEPLSTFSLEADGASYAVCRRKLASGRHPEPDAVRIEELLNYFSYDYPAPEGEDPLSLVVDAGPCPWEPSHRLVRIGLRAREIPAAEIPPSNFIYLIDVSGSMTGRLPLVQASMKMLTDNLRPGDRVSVVTYADGVRVVSENVPGSERRRIKDVIDGLTASGSTAGGAGLECAYEVAGRCFIPGGNNRIVLCSDGDFNVGPSSDDEMGALIERQRKQSGVRLSVLGYGMGNYKDRKMQLMAERGDGNYAYVDDMREAAKVLFREFGATAWAVAHDVKMQVEFNPALVASYRLVGYESRLLESEDFNDDRRDAGEIGAGHCVTALYELIPVGVEEHLAGTVDALRYQGRRGVPVVTIPSSETLAVKVRYKLPGERRSHLMQAELVDDGRERLTGDFAFAAAVAMYGQLLRLSDFRGGATWDEVIRLAQLGLGNDPEGYRREFIDLVRVAQSVCGDCRSEYPAPEPVPHSAPDAAPRSVSSAVSAPASAPGGSSGSVPASASVPVPSGASGSAAVPADR